LRSEVEAALLNADAKRERQAALRIVRLYRGRADAAWGVRRFGEHARDVRDAGELLTLAEREILVPLDAEARRLVLISAKRVATVTALSPSACACCARLPASMAVDPASWVGCGSRAWC
jgi:putative membrane protein